MHGFRSPSSQLPSETHPFFSLTWSSVTRQSQNTGELSRVDVSENELLIKMGNWAGMIVYARIRGLELG